VVVEHKLRSAGGSISNCRDDRMQCRPPWPYILIHVMLNTEKKLHKIYVARICHILKSGTNSFGRGIVQRILEFCTMFRTSWFSIFCLVRVVSWLIIWIVPLCCEREISSLDCRHHHCHGSSSSIKVSANHGPESGSSSASGVGPKAVSGQL